MPCILPVLHPHHTHLIPYYIISSTIQDRAVCTVTGCTNCVRWRLIPICQSPVWNMLHDTLSAPVILRWLLEFWKTLALLDQTTGWTRDREKKSAHIDAGAPPSLVFGWYGGTYPGVKHPGREADHSHLSSADANITWSCTPLSHLPSWRAHDTRHLTLQHGWREFLPIHQSVAVPDGVSVSSRQPVRGRTL